MSRMVSNIDARLFSCYILECSKRPLKTSLSLNLPSENIHSSFNGYAMLKKLTSKIFIQFYLTGDKEYDNKLMDSIEMKTRQLRLSNDTLHVIKVHFVPACTYGQFVQLNNIMKLEMQPVYAFWEDDFYIWEVAGQQ